MQLLTIHDNNKTFQESWLSIKITTKRKSTWISTYRCDILSPLKKTYVSWEAVYFSKDWRFKHLKIHCNATIIMSQQTSMSSIVRTDLQSFYSLDFDFHNYSCSFRAWNFPETFEKQTCTSRASALVPYTAFVASFWCWGIWYSTTCNSKD